MTDVVAYDPNNPLEQSFLGALALGETGGYSGAYSEGVSGTGSPGVNLSSASTDQYGFPLWTGVGNSHAAGAYQFEPSTWDSIAQQYDLNFTNPNDQNAGAWYEAQQADPNLYSQLQSGNFSAIQSALSSIWPSVTGNAAAPQGLANDLATGTGTTITSTGAASTSSGNVQTGTSASGSAGTGSSGAGSSSTTPTGIVGTIENFFVRFGLIIVGGIIILVALWQLLSNQGIVPSPKDVVKSAGKVAGEAIAI